MTMITLFTNVWQEKESVMNLPVDIKAEMKLYDNGMKISTKLPKCSAEKVYCKFFLLV